MEKLIEFIGNNYVWFLTISIILLFALIGYIYDNRNSNLKVEKKDDSTNTKDNTIEEIQEIEIPNIEDSVVEIEDPTKLEENDNDIKVQ